ncbi:MAG: hypothetical protein DMF78_25785 [Acidobacteria bacterium]|nr:MAG: hypothetical protein DMF78_25785 [Acidobacteriota bacterium]
MLLKWIIHWGEESGDKAFRSILDQVDRQVRTDFLLMVGDQIYADDLSNIDPDDRLDEFLKRYRTALSQPFIRKLMGRIPTYMILDDHEIKDAWTMDMRPGRETLYAAAMSAYQSYQVIHGPAFVPEGPDDVSRTPTRYISSPFFFPGPRQGQEARFDLAATIANPPHDFRIAAHGPIRGDDNFTRVSLDRGATTMKVELFDRKGGLLETADLPL